MSTVKEVQEDLNPREHKHSIIAVCIDNTAKAWHRGLALQVSLLAPNVVKEERIEAKLGCLPPVGRARCRPDGQGRIIGCLSCTNLTELKTALQHFVHMVAHPAFAKEGITVLSDSLIGDWKETRHILEEVLDNHPEIVEWRVYRGRVNNSRLQGEK